MAYYSTIIQGLPASKIHVIGEKDGATVTQNLTLGSWLTGTQIWFSGS
jgi:hypothetical protein